MHVHVSALDALIMFAYLLILGTLWRTISTNLAGRPLGRAMSFVY